MQDQRRLGRSLDCQGAARRGVPGAFEQLFGAHDGMRAERVAIRSARGLRIRASDAETIAAGDPLGADTDIAAADNLTLRTERTVR